MDLKGLQKYQEDFDNKHGFPVSVSTVPEKYLQISKDLVGLFGEIGEFANIVKKVNLSLDRSTALAAPLESIETSLKEELVDSLIYLIRIATILQLDLEEEYLRKITLNEEKYRGYK